MDSRFRRKTRLKRLTPFTALLGAMTLVLLGVVAPLGGSAPANASGPDGIGVPAGTIHHVWLIILENKSYDETFTGLNDNSLPLADPPVGGRPAKELLRHRAHQQDNYISLASGQGPQGTRRTTAATPPFPFGSNSTIVTTGSVGSDSPDWNFGQVASLGPTTRHPRRTTTRPHQPTIRPPTAAPTPRTPPPSSTSSTWPASAGRATPRIWAAPSPSGRPRRCQRQRARPRGRSRAALRVPPPNNPVTNPTLMSDTSTFPADVSSLTAASLVAGTGPSNNLPSTRTLRGQALPLPVVRVPDRRRDRDPIGAPLTEPQASAGGGTNCDANHIANLDGPTHGLVADLRTTPSRRSAGSPPTTAVTPTTPPARATTCRGPSGLYTSGRHAGQVDLNDPIYTPGRPARLRPRGHHPAQLHRGALRLGPVPGLLRAAHREFVGLRKRV